MPLINLPAPAKLNLFLHINERRQDGYHELQTLFQLLDYGDQLSFLPWRDYQQGDLVSINGSFNDIPDESNLVRKASELLIRFARQEQLGNNLYPLKIELTKRIPVGGGLGGGSSDAATTLLALNSLWKLGIPGARLAAMSSQLGADVPVFVNGHTAYAEGVGDRLQPRTIPEYWYLVIHPGCDVSTAEVFSHRELTRDTPKSTISPALEGDLSCLAMASATAKNDCEDVVCKMFPLICEAMKWLSQFAVARLTGTGSCIFACFTEQNRAYHALTQLPANYHGFVAKGINQSPVIDILSTVSTDNSDENVRF